MVPLFVESRPAIEEEQPHVSQIYHSIHLRIPQCMSLLFWKRGTAVIVHCGCSNSPLGSSNQSQPVRAIDGGKSKSPLQFSFTTIYTYSATSRRQWFASPTHRQASILTWSEVVVPCIEYTGLQLRCQLPPKRALNPPTWFGVKTQG